jgi:hypothetical protein
MNIRKSVWFLVVLLCGIGLGLIAGRMVWVGKNVEAAPAPHVTNLIIYPDGEIYVLAGSKETIRWFTPVPGSKPKPFKVRFSDGLPCLGVASGTTDVDTCKIDPAYPGTALYSCFDSQGHEFCKDPGVDPNGGNEPPLPPTNSPNTAVSNDDADVTFRLSCQGGHVVSKQTSSGNSVTKGIFWAFSGFRPEFNIQGTPQLCTTNNAQNYGGGFLCKAKGNPSGAAYTITVTGKNQTCGGSASESVVH